MVEPRRQLRRIALALGLLVTAACAHRRAHDLAGGWAGTWTREGDPLTVAVALTRTGDHYEGSFDADAMQVAGIPLANVSGAGDRVHFELAGDETTAIFDGVLAGDAITGRFVDGDAHGTFSLARAARPAAPVRREDVSVPRRSGDPGRHRAVADRAGPASGDRVLARLRARGAVGEPVPRDEARRERRRRADLRQARRRRLDRRLAVGRLRRARRRRQRGDPLAARARRRRPRADRHLRTQPGRDPRARWSPRAIRGSRSSSRPRPAESTPPRSRPTASATRSGSPGCPTASAPRPDSSSTRSSTSRTAGAIAPRSTPWRPDCAVAPGTSSRRRRPTPTGRSRSGSPASIPRARGAA